MRLGHTPDVTRSTGPHLLELVELVELGRLLHLTAPPPRIEHARSEMALSLFLDSVTTFVCLVCRGSTERDR
jgi:hypothetical protein